MRIDEFPHVRYVPGEELETSPEKYLLELYSDSEHLVPSGTFTTYGSWAIEGQFLIIWDAADVRHAYRIWDNVDYIKTVPVPTEGKHVRKEEEDEEIGTDDTSFNREIDLRRAEEEPLEPGGQFGDGVK